MTVKGKGGWRGEIVKIRVGLHEVAMPRSDKSDRQSLAVPSSSSRYGRGLT